MNIKIKDFKTTYKNGGATAAKAKYGMCISTAIKLAKKLKVRAKRTGHPKYVLVK